MGLNIGIHVKKQTDGYMQDGSNPQLTSEETEDMFFEFLNNKFPLGGFGRGWVTETKDYKGEDIYDFDVRMFNYSGDFEENYPDADMFLAITEFIYKEFSHMEGIKMETYWCG